MSYHITEPMNRIELMDYLNNHICKHWVVKSVNVETLHVNKKYLHVATIKYQLTLNKGVSYEETKKGKE